MWQIGRDGLFSSLGLRDLLSFDRGENYIADGGVRNLETGRRWRGRRRLPVSGREYPRGRLPLTEAALSFRALVGGPQEEGNLPLGGYDALAW